MNARDLLSWTRPQLEHMRQAFERPLQTWAADWMLVEPAGTPRLAVGECRAADHGLADAPVSRWRRLAQRGDAVLWIGGDKALDRSIETLLFDHTPSSHSSGDTVGARIAARAKADLLQAWARAAGLETLNASPAEQPPNTLARRWSGAVQASVEIGGCTLRLLLDPACARQLAGDAAKTRRSSRAPAPVMPLREALASATVRLRAELQPMEVPIGSLLRMACGDVIRLTHRLDAPLMLSTQAETNFCAGHPVQRDGRLGVELVPKDSR